MIPLSVPQIKGNAWQYIKECLDTNWVSSAGKFVNQFESTVAQYVDRKYAVACVNGTAALHTALLVAGIKADEEVIVPALTFVAPVNAIRYVGAWPAFMDVDPKYWQIDPQKIKDFIENECDFKDHILINRATQRRVTSILPVHLLGHPADLQPILELAQRYHLFVIDDAAESIGGRYQGNAIGSLGDISCLSFNGNKIITAGGGGIVATNNEQWANQARYLTTQAKDDPVESIHNEVGYNYRLTNIQAALGLAQMENLDKHVQAKKATARYYRQGLSNIDGIVPPEVAGWAQSTHWLYTIRVNSDEFGMDSRSLMQNLKERNIETRPLWHPIHRLKPFKDCYSYKIENTDQIYRDALSLPSSVGITEEDLKQVVDAIGDLAAKAVH